MSEQTPQAQPFFNIEKIYVKDLSVEVPHAPQIFLEREQPQVDLQIHTQSGPVEQDIYQTELMLTVTAKIKDKTVFLVEVHQAGIFRIQNLPKEALEAALAIGCPNILFPYAREVVSSAVMAAGFPPLFLQPVNFELLYMQQQAAQQAGQQLN